MTLSIHRSYNSDNSQLVNNKTINLTLNYVKKVANCKKPANIKAIIAKSICFNTEIYCNLIFASSHMNLTNFNEFFILMFKK